MKKIYLISSFLILSQSSIGQSSEWTKEDRNNVFDEAMSATQKYKKLNKEQRESLALCYLEELTKKYSKKEYQAKIEIEIKRIQQTTLTLCSKNIGVALDNEEVDPVPVKEPVKPVSKVNEGNFSRNDIVGIWRDENSKFYFNEDATYLIKWDNGKSDGGKWWINSNKEIVLEGFSKLSLISFDGKTFKYQQKGGFRRGKEIYTATKVE